MFGVSALGALRTRSICASSGIPGSNISLVHVGVRVAMRESARNRLAPQNPGGLGLVQAGSASSHHPRCSSRSAPEEVNSQRIDLPSHVSGRKWSPSAWCDRSKQQERPGTGQTRCCRCKQWPRDLCSIHFGPTSEEAPWRGTVADERWADALPISPRAPGPMPRALLPPGPSPRLR